MLTDIGTPQQTHDQSGELAVLCDCGVDDMQKLCRSLAGYLITPLFSHMYRQAEAFELGLSLNSNERHKFIRFMELFLHLIKFHY